METTILLIRIYIYIYIYIYWGYMGGCHNYGPLFGTLNIRCRSIIGIHKGTIVLTTTHMSRLKKRFEYGQSVYEL